MGVMGAILKRKSLNDWERLQPRLIYAAHVAAVLAPAGHLGLRAMRRWIIVAL